MQCSIKHHSLTHTLVKKKNSFTYRDAHLQGEKKDYIRTKKLNHVASNNAKALWKDDCGS